MRNEKRPLIQAICPWRRRSNARDRDAFTHHQHLASLACWGRLPDHVVWWPEQGDAPDAWKGGAQTENNDTHRI
jgi:hypothetical protein